MTGTERARAPDWRVAFVAGACAWNEWHAAWNMQRRKNLQHVRGALPRSRTGQPVSSLTKIVRRLTRVRGGGLQGFLTLRNPNRHSVRNHIDPPILGALELSQ